MNFASLLIVEEEDKYQSSGMTPTTQTPTSQVWQLVLQQKSLDVGWEWGLVLGE